jgi:hypothetical protein
MTTIDKAGNSESYGTSGGAGLGNNPAKLPDHGQITSDSPADTRSAVYQLSKTDQGIDRAVSF